MDLFAVHGFRDINFGEHDFGERQREYNSGERFPNNVISPNQHFQNMIPVNLKNLENLKSQT